MVTNKYYAKLPQIIGNNFDELCISVGYEKGGYNYFTGKKNPRGIYLYLKPVHRSVHIEQTMLLGNMYENGYKILIKEIGRKNQKQIDNIFNSINDDNLMSEITELYSKRLFADLSILLIQKIKF